MIQACELERIALDMIPDLVALAPIGKLRYDFSVELLGLLIVCPFRVIPHAEDNEINKFNCFEDLDNILLVNLGHGVGFHGIPNIDPSCFVFLQIGYALRDRCRVSLVLFSELPINGNNGLAMPEVTYLSGDKTHRHNLFFDTAKRILRSLNN